MELLKIFDTTRAKIRNAHIHCPYAQLRLVDKTRIEKSEFLSKSIYNFDFVNFRRLTIDELAGSLFFYRILHFIPSYY